MGKNKMKTISWQSSHSTTGQAEPGEMDLMARLSLKLILDHIFIGLILILHLVIP